jgi:hypothetical protein
MKLEPLRGWMIGRIAITKTSTTIVTPDANKGVTKFALLEAVSLEAKAAGFAPGDLVMAKTFHNIFLRGGTFHRVTFPLDDAICVVRDVPLTDLVGTDGKDLAELAEVAA